MNPIPDALRGRVFTRDEALQLGVTSRMLEASRFTRVHHGVWRLTEHVMNDADRVTAARLALPPTAHLTGITRLQQLGLGYGPRSPLRFVVSGDLHLMIDGVFLHRTKRLPPMDADGVSVAAAFVSYCSLTRVVDAIKVGDWLLHGEHTTIDEIRRLALADRWRDGAHEATWVCDHLDGRSRSLKESETRAVLTFAGLPAPKVNVAVPVPHDRPVIGDLVYRRFATVVEYEGTHHQEDRDQYNSDVERYAAMRDGNVRYVQVTHEKLQRPRSVAGEVYRRLREAGYDGPPPEFGERWRTLFARLSTVLGSKRDWLLDRAHGRVS